MKHIKIPISDEKTLINYKRAILRLLKKISVKDADAQLQEDIKRVYKLLDYLEKGITSNE